MDELVLIVGAVFDGKPHLAVMVSEKLIRNKKLNAGEIVKTAAREFNGGGGGQPFFATAGGKDADKLELAMNKAFGIGFTGYLNKSDQIIYYETPGYSLEQYRLHCSLDRAVNCLFAAAKVLIDNWKFHSGDTTGAEKY